MRPGLVALGMDGLSAVCMVVCDANDNDKKFRLPHCVRRTAMRVTIHAGDMDMPALME